MVKLCCTASVGGHMHEMMQLSELLQTYSGILITEQEAVANGFEKVFYLKQMNRKSLLSCIYLLQSIKHILRILILETPTHIISTGSMCTLPVCLLGKLLHIKVIYVESFARMKDLSLTGKIVYRFADLFIVQWEELSKRYDRAIYGGGLF